MTHWFIDRRLKHTELRSVEERAAARIEELVAKRVEEELERRREEIETEAGGIFRSRMR